MLHCVKRFPQRRPAGRPRGVCAGGRAVELFDAHCHLQDERILPRADAVLSRAAAAGVVRMTCCGSSPQDWEALGALASRHPGITPAFGLHPWSVATRRAGWLRELRDRLCADPRAGVGEIGLDHAVANAQFADQWNVFREQWRLASELDRAASLHCRRAWEPLADAVQSGDFPARFVVHSFSGSAEMVPFLAKRGAYFSFSGSLTRSGNRRGRLAAAAVPLDRLLIETDAPDIPPVAADPATGLRAPIAGPNEPANLPLVLAALSAARGVGVEELAQVTFANAGRVFGQPPAVPERGR